MNREEQKKRGGPEEKKLSRSKSSDIKGKKCHKKSLFNIFVLTGSERGPIKFGGNYLKSIKLERKYVV
jgi:hypothetical protein